MEYSPQELGWINIVEKHVNWEEYATKGQTHVIVPIENGPRFEKSMAINIYKHPVLGTGQIHINLSINQYWSPCESFDDDDDDDCTCDGHAKRSVAYRNGLYVSHFAGNESDHVCLVTSKSDNVSFTTLVCESESSVLESMSL